MEFSPPGAFDFDNFVITVMDSFEATDSFENARAKLKTLVIVVDTIEPNKPEVAVVVSDSTSELFEFLQSRSAAA